ncbi:FBD domain-containing protein [Hirschfeldia incana]|nr:FBD domain-containing protein [Hirschfeldia incana]
MGKSKQGRPRQRLKKEEEDRISHLPDSLICHILSNLPTEDAVKTSVLSTRWKSLWLYVPRLHLHSDKFPHFNAFKSFGDKFFGSNNVSCLPNIKLTLDGHASKPADDDVSYVTTWIDAAIKRKVQHLELWCLPDYSEYEIPVSLYVCETLVSLKLHELVLVDSCFVSLPCLKTMHLRQVYFPPPDGGAIFDKLVSCSPLLEELKIAWCCFAPQVFRICSLSLKKLNINLSNDASTGDEVRVVIDAPLLCSLKVNDNLCECYLVNNLVSIAKLDIALSFGLQNFDETSVASKKSIISSFLTGVSKVRDMNIYADSLEIFWQYSKLAPIPQFGCLSRLYVYLCIPGLKWVLTFLESCPNLKSLILEWNGESKKEHSKEMKQINFSSVPECFLSSLKFVNIKTRISGDAGEMKLVRYFLKNCAVLKKLTLRLDCYYANENAVLKKLLNIPRRSITCQVDVR